MIIGQLIKKMTPQHNHFYIKSGPLYIKDWEMMIQCNSCLIGKERSLEEKPLGASKGLVRTVIKTNPSALTGEPVWFLPPLPCSYSLPG